MLLLRVAERRGEDRSELVYVLAWTQGLSRCGRDPSPSSSAPMREHRADRVAVFGGLLACLLQPLRRCSMYVAVRICGCVAARFAFPCCHRLGHGRADQVFDGVAFGRGLAVASPPTG